MVARVLCGHHGKYLLVVANKTLESEWVCHHLLMDCLAYDCEDGYIAGTADHNNVSIWNNNNQVDIGLPDLGKGILGLILRRPFLVLFTSEEDFLSDSDSSDSDSEAQARINVYKVETGAIEGTLLKSIPVDLPTWNMVHGTWPTWFQSNQHLLLAFPAVPRDCINILRMDSLLDESKKTAEEVEISQIALPGTDGHRSTVICLYRSRNGVVNKKDFWLH